MTIHIKLPANMRSLAGNKSLHESDAETVQLALQEICSSYPELAPRLLDDQGALHGFVNVFLDNKNIREQDGLATKLADGDELLVVAALAGG